MAKTYYLYILTNAHHTVFYTGMTNDLERRITQHREGSGSTFVRKYNVFKLVFMQEFQIAAEAIQAEKLLKRSSRRRKELLISEQNPGWVDLFTP